MKKTGNVSESGWQDFCLLYYDQAMSSARYHFNKVKGASPHWDERIDGEAIIVDAAMEALQKAFVNYDPSRGASVPTYISRIAHNEIVDELERETKSLAQVRGLNPKQEADYTLRDMVSHIPEKEMENLKEKLRAAILKLSPIDQSILELFLEDPRTFIERSAQLLGVTPGFVSVRKNRALAKLPALMNMSASDYFELYEDHPYAGVFALESVIIPYTNPIYPKFDIDRTVRRLVEAIDEAMK